MTKIDYARLTKEWLTTLLNLIRTNVEDTAELNILHDYVSRYICRDIRDIENFLHERDNLARMEKEAYDFGDKKFENVEEAVKAMKEEADRRAIEAIQWHAANDNVEPTPEEKEALLKFLNS